MAGLQIPDFFPLMNNPALQRRVKANVSLNGRGDDNCVSIKDAAPTTDGETLSVFPELKFRVIYSFHIKYKPFQVFAFGMENIHRVIRRLREMMQYTYITFRDDRSRHDGVEE